MAWFGKKDKEKKEENNMTTLEQVRKAYEDLSEDDKKSFHQFIADRVHESIAAQERADGNEDSQSAAAREHEALGAEHADGEGDVEELHEKDDTAEEKREDKREDKRDDEREDDFKKAILDRIDALEKRFSGDSEKQEESKEEWAKRVYGVGNGVFGESKEHSEKQMTPAQVAQVIAKIKG